MKKVYLKYCLFLLPVITTGVRLSAQQVPQYAQYFINPFVYNPSLSGYSDNTNAYFIRNQKYLGFDGGNVSNILTVDGSISEKKFGTGVSLYTDQMGPLSSQGVNLSFSYTVKFYKSLYAFIDLKSKHKDITFKGIMWKDDKVNSITSINVTKRANKK